MSAPTERAVPPADTADGASGGESPGRPSRVVWADPHHRFLLLLLGVGVLVFWLPRLPGSLWLDETITAWLAGSGFGDMLDRSLEFQSMAPTYFVVAWVARRMGGASEIALRLPSLVAMAAATYLLYRLGRRLFDTETGLLAAVVLATWNTGAHLATDARPYALGTLAILAATLVLVRWFEEGRRRDAVAYVFLAALVVYVQYLLALSLVAHVAFALRRRDGPRTGWAVAAMAGAIALLVLPLLPHLLLTFDRRDALSLGPPPLGAVVLTIAPPAVLAAVAAGIALVAGRIRLASDGPGPAHGALALLGTWAVAPPVLLFVASWAMDAGVLGPQHVTQTAPAVALLVAAAIRRLGPAQERRIVLATMAIVSVLLGASMRQYQDDWRGAIAHSNALVTDPSTPVLVRPRLVESGSPTWLTDPARTEFLLVPVQVYPVEGRPVLLPFRLSEQERRYLEDEVLPRISAVSRFPVVTLAIDDPVLPWLEGRLRSEGFELTEEREFGSVVVALFERPYG